jgi:hypothetical protein
VARTVLLSTAVVVVAVVAVEALVLPTASALEQESFPNY